MSTLCLIGAQLKSDMDDPLPTIPIMAGKIIDIARLTLSMSKPHFEDAATHTFDQKILILDSSKSFRLRLLAERFVRGDRSYAVAFVQRNSIDRNCIIIKAAYMPIGPKYQDGFLVAGTS